MRWRAADHPTTFWAHWGGEYIAFHEPSGRTHLLNTASELLINRVLRQPLTSEESAAELAALQGITASEEFVANVATLLFRLEEIGLIEAA